MVAAAVAALLGATVASPAQRLVRVDGQQFIVSATKEPIVMGGPNVVVKTAPYMPYVSGDTYCNDTPRDPGQACIDDPSSCHSCQTFNQADVDHIKSRGWNFIRLGVVWAGAQPEDADQLDPGFLELLHAVLNLTDKNGLHVMLDNHGDMVGSAGCGNGVPMWVQKQAVPDLIGKPLKTDFPYSVIKQIAVKDVGGYDYCGDNETMWAKYAGDPNYNLLNECCQHMNSGNPGGLGYTTISQGTMNYILKPGKGRDQFVRYWRLMAEAVKDHPSVSMFELMNEPMSIRRRWMFDTWKACTDAITAVIPDASVSICDVGEGSVLPAWITDITGGYEDISSETETWLKASNNVFYAWHYGKVPTDIKNMQAISAKWNVPTFGTELGCEHFCPAKAANISHSYWHYSSYCNTGPWFGNKKVPEETFGGCLLGWGSGDSTKCDC